MEFAYKIWVAIPTTEFEKIKHLNLLWAAMLLSHYQWKGTSYNELLHTYQKIIMPIF